MMFDVLTRVRGLWLSASPARAATETLLIAAAIVAPPVVIAPLVAQSPSVVISPALVSLVLFSGPLCALWCALRLRSTWGRGSWGRGLLIEAAIGCLLGLIPTALIVFAYYVETLQRGEVPRAFRLTVGRIPLDLFAVIWLVAFSLGFIALRFGLRILRHWNRLRRTNLRWALTHAHLMVVVLGASVLGSLVLLLEATRPRNLTTTLLPFLFFLTFVTVVAMLFVLVPSAIFSYLFARPTTRRLEQLAAATGALRRGDYSIRVPVAGEDEVAQLQTTFNAMAADLERTVYELRAERDNVATLLRARRELVASVSHELRTPVATLRSYLESTLIHWDGAPPPTLRHDLEVMERESVHLQSLIADLFTLARAEVGRLEFAPAPVDVLALGRQAVETMAPLAWQTHRVEMAAEAANGVPLALADASRVAQVLRNLLHNGVRHTPPGGIVAVASGWDADAVWLQVKDTGEGIAPGDLPRIFERFYRGQSARDQDHGGSGLGLALVKELTEAMGGGVAVASTPGQGSCFTVRLPRAVGVGASVAGDPSHQDMPLEQLATLG
ncbi:MAG TPA: ATP-binding protein [Ktedonobacterales bacterium]|nr:ATP-binding protein [Ktedonobacterales bacterium]